MNRAYNREWLQRPDFNCLEFIRITKNVNLKDLSEQLNQHLLQVQTEIGQSVNAEFEDFVRVYRECGQVGEAEFEAVEVPLEQLHHRLNRLHARLASHLGEWEEIRGKWWELEQERRELKRIKEILGHLNDLDAIFARPPSAISPCLVEVACAKYGLVKSLLVSADDAKQIETNAVLLERLSRQAEQLSGLLEQIVIRAIQEPSDREGWLCLGRAFLSIDKAADLESLIRSRVTIPFCNRYLTAKEPFGDLVDLMVTFAKGALDQLTVPLQPEYHCLSVNAILAPLLQSLMTKLPAIFSPGQPDLFHRNHTLAGQLVNSLSAMDPHLLSHPVCQEFQRSWQTNVYFQIRSKEIQSKFDQNYREHFMRCWSPNIVIEPLLTKFFQLTLQMATRITKDSLPAGSSVKDTMNQIHSLSELSTWLETTLWPTIIEPMLKARLPDHVDALHGLFITHASTKIANHAKQLEAEFEQRIVERAKDKIQGLDLTQPDYQAGTFLKELLELEDNQSILAHVRQEYRNFAEGRLKAAQKAAANHRRLLAVLSGAERLKAEEDTSKEDEVRLIERAIQMDEEAMSFN